MTINKVGLKPKRYNCLTKEQQTYYNKLPQRQRNYIDFRGQGYSKTQSYKMAGYEGKTSGQAAYMLEARNEGMKELIELISGNNKAKQIIQPDSSLNLQIDALAQQKSAESMLATINGADGETARRIQFFRDIINGKIKTVRKTKKFNSEGSLLETKIEEVSDIETKIKARKELDRILGLNSIIDVGSLQMGDITINIVDASKKEELDDSRNDIIINADEIETIDGEIVLVKDEKTEIVPNSAKKEILQEDEV